MIAYAQHKPYRRKQTHSRCAACTEKRERYADNRSDAEYHSDIYCCVEYYKSKYAYADKSAESVLCTACI